MHYSDDFKSHVMTMYPNYKRLHKLLHENNVIASYILRGIYLKSVFEHRKKHTSVTEMEVKKIVEILNDCPGGDKR